VNTLEYLTRWRLFKAGQLLRENHKAVGEVAGAVGYESEAAFSKAFKRATGVAPGAWRSMPAQKIDIASTKA
jgi:AraC-like DNA-binding protein